jgi:hypothetical protein
MIRIHHGTWLIRQGKCDMDSSRHMVDYTRQSPMVLCSRDAWRGSSHQRTWATSWHAVWFTNLEVGSATICRRLRTVVVVGTTGGEAPTTMVVSWHPDKSWQCAPRYPWRRLLRRWWWGTKPYLPWRRHSRQPQQQEGSARVTSSESHGHAR